MDDFNIIKGNYITIEELPIGCVITDTAIDKFIVIGDLGDINLVIESLERLKEAWYAKDSI